MPLIYYRCECGNSFSKYIKIAKDAISTINCNKCSRNAKKSLGNSTSSHKITIDTGNMSKAVTVYPDINELNDERSSTDYTEDD